MLRMQDEAEDGVWICRLHGRLDGTTCASADAHLAALAQKSGAARVVLDLERVDFVSSAGLRVLLMAAKRAAATSSPLALAAPQAPVRQVLEDSGFLAVVAVHATRAEAVQAAPR